MDEFFAAVDSATAEYHAEYVPLLAKMKEDKDARAQRRSAEDAAKYVHEPHCVLQKHIVPHTLHQPVENTTCVLAYRSLP